MISIHLHSWFPIIICFFFLFILGVMLLLSSSSYNGLMCIEWWRQGWSRHERGPGLAKRIHRKRGGCIYSRWWHPNKSSGSCPKLCEYKRNYIYFFMSIYRVLCVRCVYVSIFSVYLSVLWYRVVVGWHFLHIFGSKRFQGWWRCSGGVVWGHNDNDGGQRFWLRWHALRMCALFS